MVAGESKGMVMAGESKGSDASGLRCTWGIILLVVCLLAAVSLFSYDWQDIGVLAAPPKYPPCNLFGKIGAWMSFFLFNALGVSAYLVPFFCMVIGLLLIVNSEERIWPRITWCFVLLLTTANLLELYKTNWIFCMSRPEHPGCRRRLQLCPYQRTACGMV